MRCSALLLPVWVGVVALGLLRASESARSLDGQSGAKIHREGTRLDQKALTFRTENDRLMVQIDPDHAIQVLENLGAQRIYRANQDDPEDNQWSITGSLTEFEGRNYLLIEQAVRIR
jgi:hypothetical protein